MDADFHTLPQIYINMVNYFLKFRCAVPGTFVREGKPQISRSPGGVQGQ